MKSQVLYLLQNCGAGYAGDSPLFWREGGGGYTVLIDEAKRWTWAEARIQIRSCSSSHTFKAWKLSDVEKAAVRVVLIGTLAAAARESEKSKKGRRKCDAKNADSR